MIAISSHLKFYLYSQPTDMRKSFDGLSGIVGNHLKRDPLSGDVYLFLNKRHDRLKLLLWEGDGFWILYKRLSDLSKIFHEQRYLIRQEESIPILKEIKAWLDSEILIVLPRSAIGKAIAYMYNRWSRLEKYVSDGRLEIDNNLIENAIRPIALGRKNYLFAGSHEGAKRAALYYSLLGTVRLQNVEPFEYLRDVLTRISDYPYKNLTDLLPANWKKIKENTK